MKSPILKHVFLLMVIVIVGLFIALGCSKDDNNPAGSSDNSGGNNPPGQHTVIIDNFAFSPATITISTGEKVVWRNDDNVGHTVTSDSGSELDSPLLSQGQTYEHTFNTAGSFPYHCTPHSFMTATVIVQ